MLLRSTDILRLITGAAASITFDGYYVDRTDSGGAQTPDRPTSIAAITTAATTTLIGSPASGDKRHVKKVYLTNNHATASTTVTVQTYDGTIAHDVMGVTLLPGENLIMDTYGEWHHHDTNGGQYAYTGAPNPNLGPTGTLAETMPRMTCPEVNTAAPTASGTLFMQAIYLTAGQLISNIAISSATTAAGTPTNYFFALYSAARALRAQSANQTTTAWAANTLKTLAMTTPYLVPTSGLYYIGLMVTATTVPTTKGGTAKTGGQLASTVPILHGISTTGLTTALPDPAAAITGGLVSIYAAVS